VKVRKPALAPLVRKWQRRLHLLDWDLTVKYIKVRPKPTDTFVGQCSANADKNKATILILDPAVERHDVEATLKHELLHVALWLFVKEDPTANRLEERFIERIVPLLR